MTIPKHVYNVGDTVVILSYYKLIESGMDKEDAELLANRMFNITQITDEDGIYETREGPAIGDADIKKKL